MQGLTAWHAMVDLGATKKGQVVLVHSAAGGVGALAMELCQKLGAHPIATIGSDKKVGFLVERFGVKVGPWLPVISVGCLVCKLTIIGCHLNVGRGSRSS